MSRQTIVRRRGQGRPDSAASPFPGHGPEQDTRVLNLDLGGFSDDEADPAHELSNNDEDFNFSQNERARDDVEAHAAMLEEEADDMEEEAMARRLYVQGLRDGRDFGRDTDQNIGEGRNGSAQNRLRESCQQALQDRDSRMAPSALVDRRTRRGREYIPRRRGNLRAGPSIQDINSDLDAASSDESRQRETRRDVRDRRRSGPYRSKRSASNGDLDGEVDTVGQGRRIHCNARQNPTAISGTYNPEPIGQQRQRDQRTLQNSSATGGTSQRNDESSDDDGDEGSNTRKLSTRRQIRINTLSTSRSGSSRATASARSSYASTVSNEREGYQPIVTRYPNRRQQFASSRQRFSESHQSDRAPTSANSSGASSGVQSSISTIRGLPQPVSRGSTHGAQAVREQRDALPRPIEIYGSAACLGESSSLAYSRPTATQVQPSLLSLSRSASARAVVDGTEDEDDLYE